MPRAKHAIPKRSVTKFSQILDNALPGKREIEQMRDQINSSRQPVVWSDRSNDVISERIKDEVVSPIEKMRTRRIIVNQEPIDINSPPKASQLISTTAFVQDFVGVPSSLSFIR
jgi:hypothetical protein